MEKDIVFGDMVWGSCQYDSAGDTYHKILNRKLDSVDDVTFDRIRSIEEISERFAAYLTEHYASPIWGADPNWVEMQIERAKNATSIEECFNVLRNSAWDLWSAAPKVCELVFENLQMPDIADRTDGVGPIGNISAHAENDRTGTYCALLTIYAGVDESAFVGFDT